MAAFAECPVCGDVPAAFLRGYYVCCACDHQWKTVVDEVEIENEVLDRRRVLDADQLTRAKVRAVATLTVSRDSMLDFGAGSGKFAYFCRRLFRHVEGVEVTPSCIVFARDVLGVLLRPAPDEGATYDVVTAWHSIEHLPPASLRAIVSSLHRTAAEAFLLSVPNAASWASRWFGAYWPYRDEASHYQQFSPISLRRLLEGAGWERLVSFRVPIYSVFCYAQGFTNVVTRTHNLLYFRLKRGRTAGTLSVIGMGFHAAIFVTFLPVALILTALEALAPAKASCLNVACYHGAPPRTNSP